MSLLQVEHLCKSFGGVHAVQGLSLSLHEGEMLALIGPNGAGKSTAFNIIGGQMAPDSGRVLLAGQNITGLSPRAIWHRGVGRTFQVAQTFGSFTVLKNVQMALLRHEGWHWWQRARTRCVTQALALLAQVGMQGQAQCSCSALAYGDIKRLELAMALAHAPRLLLMDEPTAGMAAAERVALMQLVRQLARERRMAVLFTEHSMDVVFGQADRVAVLVGGQLLAQGTPQQIQGDARVQTAYLGQALPVPTPGARKKEAGQQGTAPALLQVRNLHAWYGAAHILHGITLTVGRGEVVALMGRNGAGKSTTLKSLAGLLARTQGSIHFMGHSLHGTPASQRARWGLGYVPEERRIFADLSVSENLETGRQRPRTWPDGTPAPHWSMERLFQLFPNLAAMPQRLGTRMSGGEQQMLSIARTLMGQPYVLLLDEPSEGVAPIIVQKMAQTILELKAQGMGIVLCEQNLSLVQAVADRVYVLEQGVLSTVSDAAASHQ